MPTALPQELARAFLPNPPARLGVAVSGGGDSMALLHLLSDFCKGQGTDLFAVTVDHCLRDGSGKEAAAVSEACSALDIPHDVLVWRDWSGRGNLQKAARDARFRQIGAWAQDHSIRSVALGHTADDQAETVLMRLARRAGVDGLSGMKARLFREGVDWVRPLLSTPRETLRSYLTERGIGWSEDPSNGDERFERVRARAVLEALAPLGLDREALTEVARNMADARRALEWQSFVVGQELVTERVGALALSRQGLRLQPNEAARRLIIRAMQWVNGAEYDPRRAALRTVMAQVEAGGGGTLEGCHLSIKGEHLWIFRELQAVREVRTKPGDLWDGRWYVMPPLGARIDPTLQVRVLGEEGLAQCPDWRVQGLPRCLLLSTPAVWHGDTLVAAPCAGRPENWAARLVRGRDTFFAGLLPH